MPNIEDAAEDIALAVMQSYGLKGKKIRQALGDAAEIGIERGLGIDKPPVWEYSVPIPVIGGDGEVHYPGTWDHIDGSMPRERYVRRRKSPEPGPWHPVVD